MHEWTDPKCRRFADLFFPVSGETARERGHREDTAKAICKFCPDRLPCRELGLELEVHEPEDSRHAPSGVWGGLNRRDLLKLARERKRAEGKQDERVGTG